MNKTTTLLAALLLAGASQAALAQEHDHGGDRPQFEGHRGGEGRHWNGGGPAGEAARAAASQAAAQAQPIAPQGGHARFGAPPAQAFTPPPAAPQVQPAPRAERGDDRRWGGRDGERHWEGRGDRNGIAPGVAATGERRWDRREPPRDVAPPVVNAERGWDRNRDGRAPDTRRVDRDARRDGNWDRNRDANWDRNRDGNWDRNGDGRRDGAWNRDHRGPPANWRHWDRNRYPPIYASSHRYRVGSYHRPYGWFVRAWAFNDILPRGWYDSSYWIDDFYDYDLPYPPPGMHWVRVGDDALLVDDYTGRIFQVVRDIFW